MTLLRTRTFQAMGSPCELRLAARDAQEADALVRLVHDDVARLEQAGHHCRVLKRFLHAFGNRAHAAAGFQTAIP